MSEYLYSALFSESEHNVHVQSVIRNHENCGFVEIHATQKIHKIIIYQSNYLARSFMSFVKGTQNKLRKND